MTPEIRKLDLPEAYGALYVCPVSGAHQAQHEAAHALLAECLPLYAAQRKIPLGAYHLECTEAGKPFLPECPALHFNLSHCSGLAACLLSPLECGVDVEFCRPLRERVVRRVFSEKEKQALALADDPDLLFTALWTLKEAYVKALGIGIGYPMREVCFSVEDGVFVPHKKDAVFWYTAVENACISACFLKADIPAAHNCP